VEELIRVLAYPKFALDRSEIDALLADYLPFTEPVVVAPNARAPKCRDKDDQMFVDLAIQGHADALVTGDRALLAMDFGPVIETAAKYRRRLGL
jgi:putative PIN family toxin of toxin-antitoxin system